MSIHAYMAQEIARQREHELRRSAQRYSQLEPHRKRHGSAMHRAGWVLIEIGLRLSCAGLGDD